MKNINFDPCDVDFTVNINAFRASSWSKNALFVHLSLTTSSLRLLQTEAKNDFPSFLHVLSDHFDRQLTINGELIGERISHDLETK